MSVVFFLLNFPSSYFLVEKLRAFGETLHHLFDLDRGRECDAKANE